MSAICVKASCVKGSLLRFSLVLVFFVVVRQCTLWLWCNNSLDKSFLSIHHRANLLNTVGCVRSLISRVNLRREYLAFAALSWVVSEWARQATHLRLVDIHAASRLLLRIIILVDRGCSSAANLLESCVVLFHAQLRPALQLVLVLVAHADSIDALANVLLDDGIANAPQVAIASTSHRAISATHAFISCIRSSMIWEYWLAYALTQWTLIVCTSVWRLREIAWSNIIIASARCDAFRSDIDDSCQSIIASILLERSRDLEVLPESLPWLLCLDIITKLYFTVNVWEVLGQWELAFCDIGLTILCLLDFF